MIKKFGITLLSRLKAMLVVLLALVGIAVTAGPAGAYYSSAVTLSGGGITAIGNVQFSTQGDGTGVRLDRYAISTTAGCSKFEGSGAKWELTLTISQNNVNVSSLSDSGTCSFDRLWGAAPFDQYVVTVTMVAKARINNAGDKKFTYVWNLWPSGNSALVHAAVTDA